MSTKIFACAGSACLAVEGKGYKFMSREYRDDNNMELYNDESESEHTAEFDIARRGDDNTCDREDLANDSDIENGYSEEYCEQACKNSDLNDYDSLNSCRTGGYNEYGGGYNNENGYGNRYYTEENGVKQNESRNTESASGEYQMKKRSRKRSDLNLVLAVVMTLVILVAALFTAVALYKGFDIVGLFTGKTSESEVTETNGSEVTEAGVSHGTSAVAEKQTEKTSENVKEIWSDLSQSGELVLVNGSHEYKFPVSADMVNVYSEKNSSYKISTDKITLERMALEALNRMAADFEAASGKHDMIVVSGARSYEEQLDLYSARVEQYGIEDAKKYVASPGCSEHHTGLGFDMSVYTDDGIAMKLNEAPEYSWITEHAWEYGIVRRYDKSKMHITGITGEDWHFRYVGRPHAWYMTSKDLCLEEYMELIMLHTFENRLGFNEEKGTRYEVYFVPAGDGEITRIPLPSDKNIEYEISGTNCGGFAVTVTYR